MNFLKAQNTNLTSEKCFSEAELKNLYMIVKQNPYLKDRLSATEKTMKKAVELSDKQEVIINDLKSVAEGKEKVIKLKEDEIKKADEICAYQKSQLQNQILIEQKNTKIQKRKGFWNGITIGGTVGVTVGVGLIYILAK